MHKKFIDLFTAKMFEENIKHFSDYKQIYQMYLNYEKQLKLMKKTLENHMHVVAIAKMFNDDLIRLISKNKKNKLN